jgi:hypothetical protein
MRRAWSGRSGRSIVSVHGGVSGRAAIARPRRQRLSAVEAAPETDKWAPAIFFI